jgi:hypothetical protein
MTATLRPAAPSSRLAKRPRSRRWLRFAIPIGIVAFLVTATLVAYQIEEPDSDDAAYLAPGSSEAIGASRLAGLLTARGVQVERERRSSDALVKAYSGNVTLFVPAPQYMHRFYLRMLKLLPESTRVVLVAPDRQVLGRGRIPASVTENRIQAMSAEPGCEWPAVRDAGTARVVRTRYVAASENGTEHYCYRGSVVTFHRGAATVTLVGADEPFRNDRIEELDNARLAVALLAGAPKVVWLDLHEHEPAPEYIDNPALSSAPDAPPSLGPGPGDPDFPIAGGTQPGETGQPGLPDANRPEGSPGGRNPLWQAFPQWTYALTVLLTVALLLLAIARARRIGTPVTEPLPVAVRATETVEGRGRLYRRAKARGHALTALRDAEIERLRHLLDQPDDLVAAAARQAGWPPEDVRETLYGAEPGDDEDLVRRARLLDDLHHAVLREHRIEGEQP